MGSMQGDMALLSASVFNDFYYLTGFEERRGIAVIDPEGKYPFVLFVMPADPMATLWDGERQGVRGAMETFGADNGYLVILAKEILYTLQKQPLYRPSRARCRKLWRF